MTNFTFARKTERCGQCDAVATHCCGTGDGWLFFCRAHALAHRKVCPECIAKRKDAGKAP